MVRSKSPLKAPAAKTAVTEEVLADHGLPAEPPRRGADLAKYILKEKPNAKVAVFYANDDFGKDYVAGIKEIFGDKAASQIVAEESYETTEPSIDGHIVKLKGTGADVLVNISTPKFAAQA